MQVGGFFTGFLLFLGYVAFQGTQLLSPTEERWDTDEHTLADALDTLHDSHKRATEMAKSKTVRF